MNQPQAICAGGCVFVGNNEIGGFWQELRGLRRIEAYSIACNQRGGFGGGVRMNWKKDLEQLFKENKGKIFAFFVAVVLIDDFFGHFIGIFDRLFPKSPVPIPVTIVDTSQSTWTPPDDPMYEYEMLMTNDDQLNTPMPENGGQTVINHGDNINSPNIYGGHANITYNIE